MNKTQNFPLCGSLLFYSHSFTKQQFSGILPGFGPPRLALSLHDGMSPSVPLPSLPPSSAKCGTGKVGAVGCGSESRYYKRSTGTATFLRLHLRCPYEVQTVSDYSNTYLYVSQHQASQIYTGTPFPSILRSGAGQRKDRYTPQPLLNPARRGKGLYFNLSPQLHREATESGGHGGVLP